MGVYQLLRARWLEAGIRINEGVTQAAIDHFERKHAISLPSAFKEYLLIVNGMQSGEVDEHLVSFLSLDAIDQDANYKEISENQIEMVVAEYSIYSHMYVLRFSRSGDRSLVFVTDGEHEKQIATSFEGFVSQYLSSPARVAHCWAE